MEQFTRGRQAANRFRDLYGKKTLHQILRYDETVRRFKKKFNARFCYLASASGRVEIIGNHTDHNGGKVIGCTVDSDILAAFLPADDGKVLIAGNNYRTINFDVNDVFETESGSSGMAKGVLAGLSLRGYKIGGFKALLDSELPAGAGMSSSAAFQLLIASVQNHLYNGGGIPARALAEAGQYAENVYFKKPCGLFDQGVIAVGGIVEIDFSNGFSPKRLKNGLPSLNLVVTDTGKSHSSLTEHYAAIPREMKQIAALFGKNRLIDVDEKAFFESFDKSAQAAGSRAALRAKHFFEENLRVQMAEQALTDGDKEKFLSLINQSGDSSAVNLQNCSVSDDASIADAVAYARKICPGCASRVHGGGFQGTVLAFVETEDLNCFVEKMGERYGRKNVKVLRVRNVGATVL